jgi:hypothetical protein
MLSETHLSEVGNFDTTTINQLRPALGGGIDAVSAAGACDLTKLTTELTIASTVAYTLAAPTVAGQRKIVRCVAATSTPAGTLTVSSPDDTTGFVCPATFFFDNVGQLVEFQATTALKWRCVRKHRVGSKTLVVGTTVTTGICDMSHINLSVTGTVQSTGTKGIPAGAAVGELLIIGCGTAALTPHGDIFATALVTPTGGTGNTLDDFTATTDHMVLMWTGSAWQVLNNHTTAVTITTV